MASPIRVGDKIELTHEKSAIGRIISDKKYGSKLMDYDGVRTAKIAMPIFEGRIVPLEIGDEYSLCFFTTSGLYQCRAIVRKRTMEKKIYVLVIELITQPKKFQRRGFYRLDCLFSIRQRKIEDIERMLLEKFEKNQFASEDEKERCKNALDQIQPEWKEASASDLSGGGMRFHCKDQYESNDLLEIFLPLVIKEEVTPIKIKMRVIACTYYGDSRITFESRGEFVGVTEAEREQIIKFVFEEQRRRLRKD